MHWEVYELGDDQHATGTVHFYCSRACLTASGYKPSGHAAIAPTDIKPDAGTVCELCLKRIDEDDPY